MLQAERSEVFRHLAEAQDVAAVGEALAPLVAGLGLVGLSLWVFEDGVPSRVATHGRFARASAVVAAVRAACAGDAQAEADRGFRAWRLYGRGGERVGALVAEAEHGDPNEPEALLGTLGIVLDDRRRDARDRVRAGMFDALAELAGDGVIVATPDGAIWTYNEALQRMTGWSIEQIRAHGWTNLVYPDPMVREEAQRSIAALVQGHPSEGAERVLAREDGTRLPARVWSRLFPTGREQAPAMLGVFRSATSQRALLQRAIWEESQSQVERLAGGIAHEFNNLLAALMGHADIIALRAADPEVVAHAHTIVRTAQRGAALSHQVLAFSGGVRVRPRAERADRFVASVVEPVRSALPVGVDVLVEAAPLGLLLDADALAPVLANLLRNAVRAVGERGCVRVQVGAATIPASVRYRSPGCQVGSEGWGRIRVADDGPGFDDDALEHLFVPFYSGGGGRSGMGLAAARGVIGAHMGAVDVFNDGGAVVDLYLPVASARGRELDGGEVSSAHRVWVVDDQTAVLEFSRISLEAQGFQVRVFERVAQVADALDQGERPDAVVADVVMPDGGGASVRALFTALGVAPHWVWSSGHAPDDVGFGDDGARWLQKPYTGRVLGALLRECLEQDA